MRPVAPNSRRRAPRCGKRPRPESRSRFDPSSRAERADVRAAPAWLTVGSHGDLEFLSSPATGSGLPAWHSTHLPDHLTSSRCVVGDTHFHRRPRPYQSATACVTDNSVIFRRVNALHRALEGIDAVLVALHDPHASPVCTGSA